MAIESLTLRFVQTTKKQFEIRQAVYCANNRETLSSQRVSIAPSTWILERRLKDLIVSADGEGVVLSNEPGKNFTPIRLREEGDIFCVMEEGVPGKINLYKVVLFRKGRSPEKNQPSIMNGELKRAIDLGLRSFFRSNPDIS